MCGVFVPVWTHGTPSATRKAWCKHAGCALALQCRQVPAPANETAYVPTPADESLGELPEVPPAAGDWPITLRTRAGFLSFLAACEGWEGLPLLHFRVTFPTFWFAPKPEILRFRDLGWLVWVAQWRARPTGHHPVRKTWRRKRNHPSARKAQKLRQRENPQVGEAARDTNEKSSQGGRLTHTKKARLTKAWAHPRGSSSTEYQDLNKTLKRLLSSGVPGGEGRVPSTRIASASGMILPLSNLKHDP